MISLFILWPMYMLGVQYRRGGAWEVLKPFAVATILLDWVLNYSELAVLTWDWPKAGEHTFSQRLSRLSRSGGRRLAAGGWRGHLTTFIAVHMLDPFDPSGKHIQ